MKYFNSVLRTLHFYIEGLRGFSNTRRLRNHSTYYKYSYVDQLEFISNSTLCFRMEGALIVRASLRFYHNPGYHSKFIHRLTPNESPYSFLLDRGVGVHIFFSPLSVRSAVLGVLPTLSNNRCAAGVSIGVLEVGVFPRVVFVTKGLLGNFGTGVFISLTRFSVRLFLATLSTILWCRSSRLRFSFILKGFGVLSPVPRIVGGRYEAGSGSGSSESTKA